MNSSNLTAQQFQQHIDRFAGSGRLYKLMNRCVLSEGIHWFFDAVAGWLITDVAAFQDAESIQGPPLSACHYQQWTLARKGPNWANGATLTCRTESGRVIYTNDYSFVDFPPVQEFSFWAIKNYNGVGDEWARILCLPRER
jgi:hypothetical protein